jgi:hypothetical protein
MLEYTKVHMLEEFVRLGGVGRVYRSDQLEEFQRL